MKALMLIIIISGGMQRIPYGSMSIWFSDINACNEAKEKIIENLPKYRNSQFTKSVCIEVNQDSR